MRSSPSISLMIRSQRSRRIAHIAGRANSVFPQTRSDQNQNLQVGENVLATLLPPPPYRTSHLRVLILTFSLMWVLKIWKISLMWGLVNTATSTASPKRSPPPISTQHQSSAAAASLYSLSLSSIQCGPRQPHNWALFSNILKSVNLRRACAPNVSHKYIPAPIHVPICNETTVKTNI